MPIVNDGVTEPEETVALTLSGATNLNRWVQSTARPCIFGNNTALTISETTRRLLEGDLGNAQAWSRQLSAANGQTVTVNFATAQGGSSIAQRQRFLPDGPVVFRSELVRTSSSILAGAG